MDITCCDILIGCSGANTDLGWNLFQKLHLTLNILNMTDESCTKQAAHVFVAEIFPMDFSVFTRLMLLHIFTQPRSDRLQWPL